MGSVVDSSHTHHHHTTSPTGRLDKITNPPSTRLCVAQHETNIRTEPLAHGGEIKMISEWNPMENEENFGVRLFGSRTNALAGPTQQPALDWLGDGCCFLSPPCRFGKTLSTADTHTHSRNEIKNTRRVCAVGSGVMNI
jgi:hypothetical protein